MKMLKTSFLYAREDKIALPLKNQNFEIGLRHVLSWLNLGLGPKCHDPGTFGGFGFIRYPADI